MKTVMITGAKGYIGSALGEWFEKQKKYRVIRINTKAVRPENILMEGCDTVVHTAGIAHQKETKDNAPLYYEINRDYAVQTAVQARKAGVQQFILLSSMSVYGKQTGRITKETVPAPVSHYGRSKYQADLKIRDLESDTFRVCIFAAPYGIRKRLQGKLSGAEKAGFENIDFSGLEEPKKHALHRKSLRIYSTADGCWDLRFVFSTESGLYLYSGTGAADCSSAWKKNQVSQMF